MSTDDDGANPPDLQKQINDIQKLVSLQMKFMEQQVSSQTMKSSIMSREVRQVKVLEGRYAMNANEFRTFRKDWIDYQRLTNYTDKQVVLQMHMNMETDLKQAIDTNYTNSWDNFKVEQAIAAVDTIIKQVINPVVYRKEFD